MSPNNDVDNSIQVSTTLTNWRIAGPQFRRELCDNGLELLAGLPQRAASVPLADIGNKINTWHENPVYWKHEGLGNIVRERLESYGQYCGGVGGQTRQTNSANESPPPSDTERQSGPFIDMPPEISDPFVDPFEDFNSLEFEESEPFFSPRGFDEP